MKKITLDALKLFFMILKSTFTDNLYFCLKFKTNEIL